MDDSTPSAQTSEHLGKQRAKFFDKQTFQVLAMVVALAVSVGVGVVATRRNADLTLQNQALLTEVGELNGRLAVFEQWQEEESFLRNSESRNKLYQGKIDEFLRENASLRRQLDDSHSDNEKLAAELQRLYEMLDNTSPSPVTPEDASLASLSHI